MSDPNKEVGKKAFQVILDRYFASHFRKRAMDADPENPPPFKKQKHAKTDGQEPSMDVSSKSKVPGKDLHAQRKVGQSSRQKNRNPKGKQREKKESKTHEGRSRQEYLESIKREKLLLKERLRMLKAVDRAKRKQEKLERERLAKEERKIKRDFDRAKRKQEKLERERLAKEARKIKEDFDRAKRKQEKLECERLAKEARKIKEDLECEDLQVLPTFNEVQCCIPNENFADLMVILEFVHSFKEVLHVKDFFPHGFSFDVAERALSVEEAEGSFSNIIRLLMTGFFKMQGLDDEIGNSTEPGQLKIDMDDDIERALELATATRKYIRLLHGVQLKQFRLDAFSLSEVVRLHFLTSVGYMEDGREKYRYLHVGYSDRDDPGLRFCIEESELLNDIAYRSIQELALGDKLKIILCLIHQLLTLPTLRDILDDRCEKIRPLKNSLRIHSCAEKKLRESLTLRLKERKGAKPKGAEEMPSDAQNVVTDEEFQAEQNRIEKEILRKGQKIAKTAKELAEISMRFQSLPLGYDRFYRSYWRFLSLPGLFIEHRGGGRIESLSSGAAYNFSAASVSDIGDNPANRDKDYDDSEGCKSRSSNSPTKNMLVENNSNDSLTSKKLGAALQSSNKVENDPKDVNLHQDVVSTKDCEFLGSGEPVWLFCCKEDEFNLLLERLNPRGIREGPLRQVLLREKERILESILACPAVKLNPTFVDETIVPEVRKSSRNNPASSKDRRNFGHPLGTPLPEIWSQLLRDEILDTDNRLYRGGLGAVQVQNRDAWREALLNKTYDKQCDRLVWGCQAKSDMQESSECSIEAGSSEDIESTDPEFQRVMKSPFHFVQLSLMDPGIIKAYACAILQVEQGIPRKNLKHSFVADKPGEEISQLERWEMSLMSSTSYSQLYVHLLTLHKNIQWSRSALKAHCRACRLRYDAENILLCDECNRGYHIYCLTPILNCMPHGDWYCSACQPKVAARENKRQHRSSSEEHEAEASACKQPADRCDICGFSSTSFACTTCHRRFHVECCDPTKMKRTSSSWQCRTCTLHEKREIKQAGSSLCSKSPVGEDSPLASSNNDDGDSGAAINLTSSQADADPSTELAESPLVSSNDAEASLPQEPVDTPLASSNNDGGGSGAPINLTSICQKVDFEDCNPSSSQAEADTLTELAESPLESSNDAEASLPQEPVDTPLASSNNDGGGSGTAINLTSICQKVDSEDCNPSSSQAEADTLTELAESPLVSSNDAEASLPQEPVDNPLASSNNDGGGSGAAINLTSICQKVDSEDCNPSSSQAEADTLTELAESPLESSNDAEASLPQEPVDTPLASSNNDGGGSGAAINLTSICQKVDSEDCNLSSSQAEADTLTELAESPLESSNDAEASLPQEPVDTPLASSNNDGGGSGAAINLTSICQKVDFEDCNHSSSQAEADPSTKLAESPLVSSNDAEASLSQEPVDTPLASSNNDGGGSGAAINLTSICQKVDFEDCNPSSSQAEADTLTELAESPLESSNDAEASLPQEPVDTPLASSNNDGGGSGAAINLTSICQKVDFEDCNPSSSQAEADTLTELAESPLESSNDAEASLPQEPVDTPLASSNNDGGGSGTAINLTSICQKVDSEDCNPSSSQAEADTLTELAESPLESSNDAEASLPQEPVDTPLASSNNDGGGSGTAINLTSICQKVDFEDCNPSSSQAEADTLTELAESPLESSNNAEASLPQEPVDTPLASSNNDGGGNGAAINLTTICQTVDFEGCNPSSSQAEADTLTELAESPLESSNDAEASLPQEPVDTPLASSNNDGGDSGAAINLTSICQKVDFAGCNPSSSQAEADPSNELAELETTGPTHELAELSFSPSIILKEDGGMSTLKGAPESLPYCSRDEAGPSREPAEQGISPLLSRGVSSTSSIKGSPKSSLSSSDSEESDSSVGAEKGSTCSSLAASLDEQVVSTCSTPISMISRCTTPASSLEEEVTSSRSSVTSLLQRKIASRDTSPCSSYGEKAASRDSSLCSSYGEKAASRDSSPCSSYGEKATSRDSSPCSSYGQKAASRDSSPCSSYGEKAASRDSSPCSSYGKKAASRDSSPCSSYGEKAASRDSSPCSSYGKKAASRDSSPCSSYDEKAASWCSNTTFSSLDDNITPRRRSRSAVRKEMMAPRRSSRSSERANKLEQFNRDLLCDLLSELMNHKDGWPFVKPVPKSQFPDYHSVIRRPMDFMTIRARLSSRRYRSNMEFLRDVMLIFTNWDMYNSVDEELSSIGRRLQNYFYKRCKQLNLLKCLSKESTRL